MNSLTSETTKNEKSKKEQKNTRMSAKELIKSPLGMSPKAPGKKAPGGEGLGSPSKLQLSEQGSSTQLSQLPLAVAALVESEERHDYIILGEFSEQLGPVAIWTVPENAELDQEELQKDLSRMMSVDYQMWKDAVATFKEDTRNVSSNLNTGVTYYAHHFSLLDIQARGYVRPLTLAYFTESSELIMSYYIELTQVFSGVSSLLKRHNKAVMERDAERLIAEEALPESSNVYKLLRGLKKESVSVDFPQEYLPDVEASMPPPPDVLRKTQYDKPLRSMEGLCGAPAVALAKGLLAAALAKFSQDTEALSIEENMSAEQGCPGFRQEMLLRVGRTMRLSFDTNIPKVSDANTMFDPAKFVRFKPRKSPAECVDDPAVLHRRREFAEIANSTNNENGDSTNENSDSNSPNEHKDEVKEDEESVAVEVAVEEGGGDDAAQLPPVVLGGVSLEIDENSPWLKKEESEAYTGLKDLVDYPKKAPFARHIIYSLLKGRPVLVRGRKDIKDKVMRCVKLLAVFVPGYSQAAVVPWTDEPLRAVQMATLRLVGVSAAVVVPNAIKKYATVFNMDDHPSLVAPPCLEECSYVSEILPQGKIWHDDESYLSHVQEVLYKIATRAFMYYHVCCVENSPAAATSDVVPLSWDDEGDAADGSFAEMIGRVLTKEFEAGKPNYCTKPVDVRERMKSKEKFKKALGISNQDFEIIEHFAETIKMQQYAMFETPGQAPQIQLDFTPATTFDSANLTKRQKAKQVPAFL